MTKLLSILETQTLFFPGLDLLRRDNDPFEGSFENLYPAQHIGGTRDSLEIFRDYWFSKMSKWAGTQAAISSWHINKNESIAMWNMYLSTNEGVAIQTTFKNLMDSFDKNSIKWPKYGGNFQDMPIKLIPGKVEYRIKRPQNTTYIKPFFYKPKSFEYEKELRIVAQLFPIIGTLQSMDDKGEPIDDSSFGLSEEILKQVKELQGVYLPIHIDKLIQKIYIAPIAPSWFRQLVEKLIKDRYKLNSIINPSNRLPRY